MVNGRYAAIETQGPVTVLAGLHLVMRFPVVGITSQLPPGNLLYRGWRKQTHGTAQRLVECDRDDCYTIVPDTISYRATGQKEGSVCLLYTQMTVYRRVDARTGFRRKRGTGTHDLK